MTHPPMNDPDTPMPSYYGVCKTPGCMEIVTDPFAPSGSLCLRCRKEFESFTIESLLEDTHIPLEDLIETN